MKQQANKQRCDIHFNIYNRVLLKVHPYQQHSLFRRAHQKLASRYYAPYEVLEIIDSVAYPINLPLIIHPIFLVSQLKRFIGPAPSTEPKLPSTTKNSALILEPEYILDTHWTRKSS